MKKWLFPIILITLLILFFVTGLHRYVSLSMLQSHHSELKQWASEHFFIAACAFTIIYILTAALSIPGATIVTLIGGLIFGTMVGSILVVFSATIGALIPFIATRSALADTLKEKAGPRLKRFEQGFKRNETSYLLFIRLVPIFPFWLTNIATGLLNVRIKSFIWTTFIGIIPGTIVYVAVGNGMGKALQAGNQIDLGIIFHPEIFIPLLGLGVLALIPIALKTASQQH